MSQGTCTECGADVQVAIWDDGVLSGAVVLMCYDCSEEAPEHTLWDVSALEEAHEEWPDEDDHPNLISEHPLDESSDWVVQNRYRDRETYLEHFRASWDGDIPEEGFPDIDTPDGECWDVFVWDADDADAIEAAREYLERKRDKESLKQ